MKQLEILAGTVFNRRGLTTECPVLIGHAIMIDLLFLPYVQWVIVPLSLPVVLLTLASSRRLRLPKKEELLLVALFTCVGLSVAVSSFLPQSRPYAIENTKRLIQFTTSFAYLACFYSLAQRFGRRVFSIHIFYAFVLYFFVLSILFFLTPTGTRALMSTIYGRLVTPEDRVRMHLRFAYLFTDPNTAVYCFLVAGMPLLHFAKSVRSFFFLLLLLLFPVFISQSRGGLLALGMGIFVWAFSPQFILRKVPKRRLKRILLLSAGAGLAFLVTQQLLTSPFLEGNRVVELIISRLTNVDAYRDGGSRFKIWTRYATQLSPMPLGRGYMFNVGMHRFYPHSDLLRLIYSYGGFAAALFIYMCFRNLLRYPLFILPALMAFAINSLIDEQKLFSLFLSLLGMCYGGAFRSSAGCDRDSARVTGHCGPRSWADG